MTDQQLGSAQQPSTGAAGATMTGIAQDRYDPEPERVLRVTRLGVPAVADGQVLVRVHAASVDRGTWHIMSGLPYPIRIAGFGLRRPKYANPGRSLAGTVEAVGARVTGWRPGDQVYGIGEATLAEYARARGDRLAAQPASASLPGGRGR